MANWKERIELGKVLSDMSVEHDLSWDENECPEEVKEAIAAEISKSKALIGFADDVRSAFLVADVNRVISEIYDAADRQRVWCGF